MLGEVGVEFTLHELGVLAHLLDLPTAAGLESNPIDDLPEAARSAVTESVLASLEARAVVTAIDEGHEVAEPIKLVITAASAPGLVGIAARQVDEIVETTFLSVTPNLAVEMSAVAHSVFRLTPFAPSDLMARLMRLSDLHPVEKVIDVDPVEFDQEQMETAAAALLGGEDGAALQALGGPNEFNTALLSAMKTKRSSSQITLLHHPEAGRMEGGMVAWMDGGFGGLWVLEATDIDGEPTGKVEVSPADAKDIVSELFTFLPDSFTEASAESDDQ